jgi:hypothetical protein
MPFEDGNTLGPRRGVGRPLGSKNKLTKQFEEAVRLADERFTHPYLMMAEWANDPEMPIEIRAAMLKECASYRCIKPKRTVAIETQVPTFSSEEQAETFLAEFIAAIAPDLEPVELATITRQWIASKREGKELELKAEYPNNEMKIHIAGGLPQLPGTNVIMPKLNGHAQTELPPPDNVSSETISGNQTPEAKDGEP